MTHALIAAANSSGPAPITHAREVNRLDRAGEVRLELPGCDPRTSDTQVYADTRLVRYAEEFAHGTITSVTRTENNGVVDLVVGGGNRMAELADIVVKIATVGTTGTPNVPIAVADAVQAVMTAVPMAWGWSTDTTTYGPSTDTVYLDFSGESVLEALGKIRDAVGHHFVAEGRTLVWRYKQLTNRGLTAIRNGRDIGTDFCYIDGEIEVSQSLDDVATRYYYTGSGNGTAKDNSTVGGTWTPPDSNYAFGTEVVSGRTLYYLAYTPTDSVRTRQETRTYSNISDPNQLRQSVYEDLRKYVAPRVTYRFDVTNVRTTLLPGDVIHVIARTTTNGYRALDIDTDVVVLETTREIDNDDSYRVGLVVSTTDDWTDTTTDDVVTTLRGKVADLERKDQPVARANYATNAALVTDPDIARISATQVLSGANAYTHAFRAANAASVTVAAANSIIECNSASNAITVTLLDATLYTGRVLTIKRIGSASNSVTVVGPSSQTIDGAANKTLVVNESIMLYSNGSNWRIMARHLP